MPLIQKKVIGLASLACLRMSFLAEHSLGPQNRFFFCLIGDRANARPKMKFEISYRGKTCFAVVMEEFEITPIAVFNSARKFAETTLVNSRAEYSARVDAAYNSLITVEKWKGYGVNVIGLIVPDFNVLKFFSVPVKFIRDIYDRAMHEGVKIYARIPRQPESFDDSSVDDERLCDDLWALVFKHTTAVALVTAFHILMPTLFDRVLRKIDFIVEESDFRLYFSHPQARIVFSRLQNARYELLDDEKKLGTMLIKNHPFEHLTVTYESDEIKLLYFSEPTPVERLAFRPTSDFKSITLAIYENFVSEDQSKPDQKMSVRFAEEVVPIPAIVIANCSTLSNYARVEQSSTLEFVVPPEFENCARFLKSFVHILKTCSVIVRQYHEVDRDIANYSVNFVREFVRYYPKKAKFQMMNFANYLGARYLLECFAYSLAREMETKPIRELYHEFKMAEHSLSQEEVEEKAWFLW
jgi:hypothetical protein